MRDKKEQADEQPDPGRRGLLTGSVLTRAGRESLQREKQQALGPRPPWHHLLTDGCRLGHCEQECAASCPAGIIDIYPQQHVDAGTPWLNFSVSGCTFCGDCADACPSIENYQNVSSRLAHVHFNVSSCLSWNNVFCMSCISRCSVRSLRLDARRRLMLDESLCTGCGMCINACPGDAITSRFE